MFTLGNFYYIRENFGAGQNRDVSPNILFSIITMTVDFVLCAVLITYLGENPMTALLIGLAVGHLATKHVDTWLPKAKEIIRVAASKKMEP